MYSFFYFEIISILKVFFFQLRHLLLIKMKSNRPNRIAKKRLIFGCSLILFIGIIFLVAAAVLFFYVKSKVKEQIINVIIVNF